VREVQGRRQTRGRWRKPLSTAGLLACLACSRSEGEAGTAASVATSDTADAAGSEATSASTVETQGDVTGGTTTDSEGSGGPDTTSTTTNASNPTSDTGPPPWMPVSCALEDLDPEAEAAEVLDYGDAEGQIPTIVGEALLRNCGCHYTDNVGDLVDYTFENPQPLSTLQDFHDDFKGTFPQNYQDRPAYEAVERRVVHADPLPMPTFECVIEGGEFGMIISDEDLALFTDWLQAQAPDGATYVYEPADG
jgi:hypothetical protein